MSKTVDEMVEQDIKSPSGSCDLPPLPSIPRQKSQSKSLRPLQPLSPTGDKPTSPSFAPLSHTASRVSSLSAHTFIDSAGVVAAIDTLTRLETRVSRAGKGYTVGVIHEQQGRESEDNPATDQDEKEVAVQITPDGEELTFPDGIALAGSTDSRL